MPAVVAALLDSPLALASLRRSLPKGSGPLRGCRTAAALATVVESELVDAIVLGARSRRTVDLADLRRRFPGVPVVLYGVVRSDEGRILLDLAAIGVRIVIEGIDDPMVGDLVARSGAASARREALVGVPALLRLTEPLQRRAFDLLAGTIGKPPSTTALARRLRVSREHLSRQFGAGGAPNLKRVTNLLQILAVRDFISNPGYGANVAADRFGFVSLSHLRTVVRRLVRLPVEGLPEASQAELVRRFVAQGGRSRPR